MQFSQYTQQIVWIWLKAAQMNATESTNTINNQFLSLKWTDVLTNKPPNLDLLQTEIHLTT